MNCVGKCLCDAEITFPYTCEKCGHICESYQEYWLHPCSPGGDDGDETEKPPVTPDNPTEGDGSGDDGNGDDGNGGDNSGDDNDGEGNGDSTKKKYELGFPSLKNLKNLFDRDFWTALFTGNVEVDILGLVVSILCTIAGIALVVFVVVQIIKRITGR